MIVLGNNKDPTGHHIV